jgi:competence protein ComEC
MTLQNWLRTRRWTVAAAATLTGSAFGCIAEPWRPGLVVAAAAASMALALAAAVGRLRSAGIAGPCLVLAGAAHLAATEVARCAQLGQQLATAQSPGTRTVNVLALVDEPVRSGAGRRARAQWLASCDAGNDGSNACRARDGTVQLWLGPAAPILSCGHRIELAASVEPLEGFGNPGAFDPRQRRLYEGIVGRARVTKATEVKLTRADSGGDGLWLPARCAVIAPLTRLREAWAQRTRERVAPQQAELVNAFALGDDRGLSPQLRDWLRGTGTAHVVAVSGSHLVLAMIVLRWTLGALIDRVGARIYRRWPREVVLAMSGVGAAWTYALFTGAAVATIRAAWMVTAVLAARALGRARDAWEALGLAVVVQVVTSPLIVLDVGFQLSVAGVAGLLWANSLMDQSGAALPPAAANSRPAAARRWLKASVCASLAAWATTTPVVGFAFGAVPVAAPLVNLVAVPVAGLVLLPGAWIAVAAAQVAWLPNAVSALSARLSMAPLIESSERLAGLAQLWIPASPWAMVLALAPASGLYLGWQRRRIWAGAALVVAAGAAAWFTRAGGGAPDGGCLNATFLDVGHGDSVLLRFPDRSTMLIDGGGGRVGALAVVPALRQLGVTKLDRMVLTHAHPDHAAGLVAVAAAVPVREFWWNGQGDQSPELVDLVTQLRARGTWWRGFPAGGRRVFDLGGATLRVLWPTPNLAPHAPWLGLNDNSLVLEVAVEGHRLLLTGDIEAPAERLLVAEGRLRPVTVVKVPHHGSRTSSTPAFLAATQPSLAVASARPIGRWPLPHPSVAQRYRDFGTPLWSTAAGHVTVTMCAKHITALGEGRRAEIIDGAATRQVETQ